jgi:site-specific recombinase XerD
LCAGQSATKHLPRLDFPYRKARIRPILGQQERLDLLRDLLDNDQQPLAYRVAAVLLLLYAQPLTRIAQLTAEQITANADGVSIRFDTDLVPVPEPFANLVCRHLQARPNMMTASNQGSAWLFPGYRPGQPLHPHYLMRKLRDSGIHLLGARNAALRELVLEMPPPIVAHVLGYSAQVAEKHAEDAGRTWVTYASYRGAGRTR